jgi:D-hexose-6-phosphate mutarotase
MKYVSKTFYSYTFIHFLLLKLCITLQLDRIYLGTPSKIVIIDHEKKRTFVVRKGGLPDAGIVN